jgi:VWFA-related protein
MRALSQVLIALFCWFSFPAFVQQGAFPAQITPPDERPAALAPRADRRITLDVVVTDRSGKPVPGLQQQDFTLLDNKQPRTIFSFSAVDGTSNLADRPLQAIVLVDAINTWSQGVAFQREQLEKFLRHDGGELPMPMSLVLLPDTSEGQTVVTRDGNALVDSLNSKRSGLRTISRSQGYYGGAECRQISLNALGRLASYEATQPGRKLLIWLGPGWPLLNGPAVELGARDQDALFHAVVWLSTALREARVTLYNVDPPGMYESLGRAFHYGSFLNGVGSADKIQNGNLALQVLAVQSGGRVLNASNDIADSIASCLVDAKASYTLSFDAPVADHPNEYHNLQVKIGKPGLTARTRTGYYAQP